MTFSRSELTFQDFPGGVGTRRAGSPVTRRRLMPVSGSSGCACRWLSVSSAALPSLGVLHHDAASPPQPADAPGNTHTHHLMALGPGLCGWAGTRKVKPIWILLKQETVSGSGISWAICKSAPRCGEIMMQFFYRSDALPATQPTASKHWRLLATHHCQLQNIDPTLWESLSTGYNCTVLK